MKDIMNKKRLFGLVRFVISAALITFLLRNTEFAAIFASMKSASIGWLTVALILLLVGKFLTAYRWQILLRANEINIPLLKLIASLYVGQFFNSFLPSTIGGDTVRAYDTAVYSKQTTDSVTSLFIDRLIGLFALVFLAFPALLIGYATQEDVQSFTWLIVLAGMGCVAIFVVIFNARLAAFIAGLLERIGLGKIAAKVTRIHQSFAEFKNQRRVLLNAFFISILLQINVVLFYYAVAVSLDLGLSPVYFFIIIPIILIILLVPFSINGIGIRESAYIFFLTPLGVPSEATIALSWLAFGLMLTQGLLGGVIFALRNHRSSERPREAFISGTE